MIKLIDLIPRLISRGIALKVAAFKAATVNININLKINISMSLFYIQD